MHECCVSTGVAVTLHEAILGLSEYEKTIKRTKKPSSDMKSPKNTFPFYITCAEELIHLQAAIVEVLDVSNAEQTCLLGQFLDERDRFLL